MYFRIREARKSANLTQKDLSEMLGIKVSTLSGYEVGAHDPKSNTLAEIARICGVTVDFLLGLDPATADEIRDNLGSDSPAAKKLQEIKRQFKSPMIEEMNRAMRRMTLKEQKKMIEMGKVLFPDRFTNDKD